MNKPINISKIYVLSFSILIAIIDQYSKYLASRGLSSGQVKTFIPHVLQFRLAINYGAAFSLFSNLSGLLGLLSITFSTILIFYIIKSSNLIAIKAIGLSFLLGGSLGNCIDRLLRGYVYDFIELIPINFPIFNLADISINIGILCIIPVSYTHLTLPTICSV